MKKYIILIAALVAALACNRQPAVTVTPDLTLLSFTVGTEDTKTSLDGKNIVWSTSDCINVFSGASFATNTAFSATSVENSGLNATFEGLGEVSPEYYALFPYQSTATISPAGVITAELPSTQAAVPGSFGPEANLAVAYITGTENLQFKNVGALLGVTVPDAGITGLKVESLGGQPLTGTAQISYNGGEPAVNITSGNNSVETAVSGVGTYYFVVFPGSYSDGFRITLTRNGYTASVKNEKALTLGRNDNVLLASVPSVPDDAWKVVFTPGEKVYLRGVSSSEEQEVSYISPTYYDPCYVIPSTSTLCDEPGNRGDADNSEYQMNTITYNYEVWAKLEESEAFYFETASGARFGLDLEGTSVAPLAQDGVGAARSVSNSVYRIRMNLPSGQAQMLRVGDEQVLFQGYPSGMNVSLSYVGKGAWEANNQVMSWIPETWDPEGVVTRYLFKMWFNWEGGQGGHNVNIWQTFGTCSAYNNKSIRPQDDDPANSYYYLQPFKNNGDWEAIFYWGSWLYRTDQNNTKKATISLYMNNTYGHFTHGFSNVVDNN